MPVSSEARIFSVFPGLNVSILFISIYISSMLVLLINIAILEATSSYIRYIPELSYVGFTYVIGFYILFLSYAGVPPFAGFFAKLYVLRYA
jgi:NADH:ubiquinone oxidoreductase subunit 2 (subunit N)